MGMNIHVHQLDLCKVTYTHMHMHTHTHIVTKNLKCHNQQNWSVLTSLHESVRQKLHYKHAIVGVAQTQKQVVDIIYVQHYMYLECS